ncbi:unnamed protein product [Linum trigynum]|uniref:Uncharacterized protein n=1 Tax=Linum trigynum TaxID=586398 RepID=A0AAV2EZI2_9ROSI
MKSMYNPTVNTQRSLFRRENRLDTRGLKGLYSPRTKPRTEVEPRKQLRRQKQSMTGYTMSRSVTNSTNELNINHIHPIQE